MKTLTRNQVIIVAIALILFFFLGSFLYWFYQVKEKIPSLTEKKVVKEKEAIEIFSLAGILAEIDSQNNFLIVKHPREEKEFKVILSEDTKIIKLEFPFDPKNPPKEATFTPKRTEITINDLEIGDNALIETTINIYGKTEFDEVSRIQVLP
jgi:hypothetical protein